MNIHPTTLIYAVMSRPLAKDGPSKITCRPLQSGFQFTLEENQKAFHQNCAPDALEELFYQFAESFKEIHLFTKEADLHYIRTKANTWKILKAKPSKKPLPLAHNRQKHYLLEAGSNLDFWKALGIANAAGLIKPDKQAKYRQVNRYIELLKDVLTDFPEDKPLTIIDFGCGKAYLTFALYQYLDRILKRQVKMIGIDLKQDVVEKLEEIRKVLRFDNLAFYTGDIRTHPIPPSVDLVISLHACDTATDAVLERAIEAKAHAIVAVPCCQHAFLSKIDHPDLKPLLKHGILKERFSALATDAARAMLLESKGYDTQVLEFIETEHTPKNLMIRAILSGKAPKASLEEEYHAFFKNLNLKFTP